MASTTPRPSRTATRFGPQSVRPKTMCTSSLLFDACVLHTSIVLLLTAIMLWHVHGVCGAHCSMGADRHWAVDCTSGWAPSL